MRPWVLLQLNRVNIVHCLRCWHNRGVCRQHILYRVPDWPFLARRVDQLLELCGERDVRGELQCDIVCALSRGYVPHRRRRGVLVHQLPRGICGALLGFGSLRQLPWGWQLRRQSGDGINVVPFMRQWDVIEPGVVYVLLKHVHHTRNLLEWRVVLVLPC